MRLTLIAVLLAGCGGSNSPGTDGSVQPANLNGCWNYKLGSAAGTMHLDGSVGDFTWNAQPPAGSIFRTDEPDGVFIMQFYCHTIDCGLLLADGGTKPKDTAPDSGDSDTRFLFSADGKDPAHVSSDAGAFTMSVCPP